MFDFTKLIQRKTEIHELYTELTNRYAQNKPLSDKLRQEYITLMKLIIAGERKKTLEEAAKDAGTSTDSARRWTNGKLPCHFSYASGRKIDIEKLKQDEAFIFLLGTYQSKTLKDTSPVSFKIQTRDAILEQRLNNIFKKCFGDETKKREGKNGFTIFTVNSKSLMMLVKDATYNNTTPPESLLTTENKREFYYSGFLTNIKVNIETQGTRPVLHASLTRSRGNIMNYVHSHLEEKRIPHHYYPKEKKIRFRGRECIKLAKYLQKCDAKEKIEQNKKYI